MNYERHGGSYSSGGRRRRRGEVMAEACRGGRAVTAELTGP